MKRIESFTGVRILWAISIMIFHIYLTYSSYFNYRSISFFQHGNFAVICFFILSGFLTCMHYEDLFDNKNLIKQGLSFGLSHVKKYYLLYLISILPALIMNFQYVQVPVNVTEVLSRLFVNLFLVQSWSMNYEFSLNGVAWYLSALLAIHILTPCLMQLNKKIKKNKIVSILVLILCLCISFYVGDILNTLYFNPLYRIFQFMAGVQLYNIIKDTSLPFDKLWAVLAICFQLFAYFNFIPVLTVTIDCLSALFFITAFYSNTSIKIFSSKLAIKFGNISTEVFLLHYPIVQFLGMYMLYALPHNKYILMAEQILLVFLSIGISYVYHYKFKKLKFMKNLDTKLDKYL